MSKMSQDHVEYLSNILGTSMVVLGVLLVCSLVVYKKNCFPHRNNDKVKIYPSSFSENPKNNN